MLSVAIAALLLGTGVQLWRRHRRLLGIAIQHETTAAGFRDEARGWIAGADLASLGDSDLPPGVEPPLPPLGSPGTAAPDDIVVVWRDRGSAFARLARYHAALGKKYRKAAARPWLSVESDPEPPPGPEIPVQPEGALWDFVPAIPARPVIASDPDG
jgi:hypothetical protein